MIVSIFKRDFIAQYILFGIAAIVMWISPFVYPAPMIVMDSPAPLYNFFYILFSEIPFLYVLIGFLLLLAQSFWFKEILSKNDLFSRTSSFVGLVYFMLMSSSSSHQTLTPLIFSNFLIIIALGRIFAFYQQSDALLDVFNCSFLLSLAGMFFLPSILLFPLIWLSFIVYRQFLWRDWLISIIGLITPWLFLISFSYLNNSLMDILQQYTLYFQSLKLYFPPMLWSETLFYGIMGFFALPGFFLILRKLNESPIAYRKRVNIIILFLLISIVLSLLGIKHFENTEFLFLPLSYIVAVMIFEQKRGWMSEMLFLIFIVSIVVKYYF